MRYEEFKHLTLFEVIEQTYPDYSIESHQEIVQLAAKLRFNNMGAANYWYLAGLVDKGYWNPLEKYFEEKIEPILQVAGYPKIGSKEWHACQLKIIQMWKLESRIEIPDHELS
jgi:hypothetical protein